MEIRVGFFRGLNVGGKNKLSMTDLKQIFLDLDFADVQTQGNTGIILYCQEDTKNKLTDYQISTEVFNQTAVATQYISMSFDELSFLMEHLPDWWNENKDWRHNVILLLENYPSNTIMSNFPSLDSSIEKVVVVNNIIFWSSTFSDRSLYYKSQYRQLIKHEAYPFMTIRNANSLSKLYNQASLLYNEKKSSSSL